MIIYSYENRTRSPEEIERDHYRNQLSAYKDSVWWILQHGESLPKETILKTLQRLPV